MDFTLLKKAARTRFMSMSRFSKSKSLEEFKNRLNSLTEKLNKIDKNNTEKSRSSFDKSEK